MGWDAHLMSGFCEEIIVFWAALFSAWFVTIGAVGNMIGDDDFEHRVEEGGLLAGFSLRGVNRVGKVTQSVEGSFEAQAAKLHAMEEGGALHERADEVVGNNMEQKFFLDHRWCQAAQDIEGECDFDFSEMKLHAPALQVKRGYGLMRDRPADQAG